MAGNGPCGWEAGQASIVVLEYLSICPAIEPEALNKYKGFRARVGIEKPQLLQKEKKKKKASPMCVAHMSLECSLQWLSVEQVEPCHQTKELARSKQI